MRSDRQGAVARLRLPSRGWKEILPDDQLGDLATEMMDKHSLRAAESLQLAPSLIRCEQRPSGGALICGDQGSDQRPRRGGFSGLSARPVGYGRE